MAEFSKAKPTQDDRFQLHERLKNDTVLIGDFPLCRILLMNDSNYPWVILVPRRGGARPCREIHELSATDRLTLMEESSFCAENMAREFGAYKMNVASLGNMVEQLHVHHIVRQKNDKAWPDPVWGKFPAIRYTPGEESAMTQRLQKTFREKLL